MDTQKHTNRCSVDISKGVKERSHHHWAFHDALEEDEVQVVGSS